jgi:hypothetical protein
MVCGLDTSSGGTREAVCLPESDLEGEHGRQQAIVIVDPLSSGAVLAQVRLCVVGGPASQAAAGVLFRLPINPWAYGR